MSAVGIAVLDLYNLNRPSKSKTSLVEDVFAVLKHGQSLALCLLLII